MIKLNLNTKQVYQWNSETIKCPDKKLSDNNYYNFYSSLKIDNKEFVIGSGALIKSDNKIYFGCIHYFYEIKYPGVKSQYRVAVELFYKPKDIEDKLIEIVEFEQDYEVIKKEQLVYKHFMVTAILNCCTLVFGLKEEKPQELIQEFSDSTTDPIYICRFVARFDNNKYILSDAVNNNDTSEDTVIISDSENSDFDKSFIQKKYSVTTSIENDTKILLKIKREPIEQKKLRSPSTLLNDLHISDNTQELISTVNSNFQKLLIKSPKQMEQNTPNIRKSTRLSARNSTILQEIETTPSSRTKRQSTRKSSTEFNSVTKTPKRVKETKCNTIEEVVETPTRKRRTSVVKIETTPKKISKTTNTPKSSRTWFKKMTPSIQERDSPMVFCDTPMSRARLGLSAHNIPIKMPCREPEYLSIYNFVATRIKDQTSGCMYISGVPGTGKTMTVFKVMNDMSEQKEDYGEFVFLKLNALALTEPRQIYVEIIKKLLHKKLHWEEALKEMNRFFKAKKKKISHVILIDELDKLCNRKQDVVYNLLDLPFNSVTPLIVITIANTMDLPERILSNKVNSRLGLIRQTFKPYQYKDLVKIVTERLAADAVFKNEALELVARKVAAVSGDARRALTMCSRATEIAEEENKQLVSMDIVDRVVKEMSSSSKVQAIQCCSKLEQFILSAIANEVTRTGNEEVPFLNMLYNLEKLCVLESFKFPAIELILKSCHNLGSFRLLITQHGRTDLHMTLMLNISTDDIHYALRN